MGSVFEFVTIDRAAEALEVCPRTIYRYIERGHLRTAKQGTKLLVSRKDVKTLLDLEHKRHPKRPVNKITMAQLEARVHDLEHQMSVVRRLLDFRVEPLSLTTPELCSLYTMVQHATTVPWSPHQEKMWTETFCKIQLEDLEKIHAATEDEDPWRPFYQLCKAMFDNPHDSELKLQLNAGKNNLEKLAYIWSKRVWKDARDMGRMAKRDDIVVRKLCRKVGTKRPKKQDVSGDKDSEA